MARIVLLASLVVPLLGGIGVVAVGEALSHPQRSTIRAPPPDLQADSVLIPYAEAQRLAGWRIQGTPGAGAVLLLHGVRSDRNQMVARARFLRGLGYGVLLVDLPAHGESSGERISFGPREALGVRAALAYMRRSWPDEALGVIGVSLGAAATVMAGVDNHVHAVVLESMYPSIDAAVTDRLRIYLGPWGPALSPLLLWQFSWRPIDQVAALHSSVLIASGALDRRTPLPETQRIFDAAAPDKELWTVDGAAHVDLHAVAPAAYEARIGNFLQRHLRAGSKLPAQPAASVTLLKSSP